MPTGARHVPFNSRRTVHTVSQPPKICMPIQIVLGSWHIQTIMQQRHNVAYAYRARVAAFNVVNKKINAFVPIELGSQQNAAHAYRARVVAFSIQSGGARKLRHFHFPRTSCTSRAVTRSCVVTSYIGLLLRLSLQLRGPIATTVERYTVPRGRSYTLSRLL